MADSAAFEAACTQLEERGSLDRLASRGTIRLLLKSAGLDPKSVTAREMAVAIERMLPAELSARGVREPESLCAAIAKFVEGVADGRANETPEAIFARLATP